MHSLLKRRSLRLAAAAVALTPAIAAAQTVTQTFDTGPGDFIGLNVGLPPGSTNYWVNENLTGYTPAGELGGNIPSTGQAFLADTTIGPGGTGAGILSLSSPISGSGEFWIGPTSQQTNGAIFLGHMTQSQTDGQRIGIQISDGYRFWCDFGNSQSGGGEHSGSRGVVNNFLEPGNDRITLLGEQNYRFTYSWDPTTRVLRGDVWRGSDDVQLGYVEYTASASEVAAGATLDSFGFERAGNQGPGTDVRLDNVVYSTGTAPPTPTWNAQAGNWLSSGNWVAGLIGNGVGVEAIFGTVITANRTVFADSPVTLGKMTINSPNMYNFTGAASLTMQGSGANSATIEVLDGSQKINLPLFFASS
ncbi:MAG TPA: hypothetical protein VNL70_06000, partial [Tepidisphaeraceae bacterium]|nr:hypothetical protein [Tepidisphaeraceae bacterium]